MEVRSCIHMSNWVAKKHTYLAPYISKMDEIVSVVNESSLGSYIIYMLGIIEQTITSCHRDRLSNLFGANDLHITKARLNSSCQEEKANKDACCGERQFAVLLFVVSGRAGVVAFPTLHPL